MNLFDILKENVTEEVIKKTAKALGENPENTQTAFEAMMQTLVGGLMKRTTSSMGLNQLFGQVQKSGFDTNWLATLPQILSQPADLSELIVKGGSLTSQLFPAMKSQISGMVLGLSGIRSSSASSLISIATPMVVATLSKIVAEKQMNADGLAEFLIEQRDILLKETSPELMDKMVNVLALQDIISGKVALVKVNPPITAANKIATVGNPKTTLNPPVFESKQVPKIDASDEQSEGGNAMNLKWFLIALAAIGVITAAVFAFQYFNNKPDAEVAEETVEPVAVVADTVKASTDSVLIKIDTTKVLPISPAIDSTKLAIPVVAPAKLPAGVKSAFAQQLMDAKVGDAVVIKGIDYEANSINTTAASNTIVGDLIKLMVANPMMQIKIINLSNDAIAPQGNKALSISRAYDLKKKLMVAGIDVSRIDAAGIGSGVGNANLKQVIIKLISK
jgi:outer membrane protein OmpA-like peptidoglycan-associated protein